jgi:sodium/hydrogen antiporter
MDVGFAELLAIVGALIVSAAALSGLMRGTVLSISVLAVSAGIALALLGAVEIDATDPGLIEVIELALILTLFADGLIVERELLGSTWRPPLRALTIAMPLTIVILGVAAKLLFPEFSWAEAFLLGAVLAPTDPVVTSSVVSAEGVPADVRHTLNLESGLNDGLALPLVLVLLAIAAPGGDAASEGLSLIGEAGAGVLLGAGLGVAGGWLLPRLPGGGLEPRYEGLYALGLALLAYSVADLTIANGLIAAFVCGLALGATERELPDAFVPFSENVSAIFQVLTFFAFGALIVSTGYSGSVAALVAFILIALLIARPAAVAVAFIGTRLPPVRRAFIGWFGPKGVASMLFALLVLSSTAPDRTLEFDIAAFVILVSVAAHGLTDTLGARWIERRLQETGDTGSPARSQRREGSG